MYSYKQSHIFYVYLLTGQWMLSPWKSTSADFIVHSFGSGNGLPPAPCKHLLEPMLIYCQLFTQGQPSGTFETKYWQLRLRRYIRMHRVPNNNHFVEALTLRSTTWVGNNYWLMKTSLLGRWQLTLVLMNPQWVDYMDLLPDTQNCRLRMRRECRERFPRHRLERKPLVCDPGMHHGTCVTHMPWCMSGSLTRGGGENVPGIPGACATCNFAYLVRGPWHRKSLGPGPITDSWVIPFTVIPTVILKGTHTLSMGLYVSHMSFDCVFMSRYLRLGV